MNIEIIGGGSLGLLLAGRLAAARIGGSLTLVVRTRRQAEAVARLGITVQNKEGKPFNPAAVQCMDVAAYSARTQYGGHRADWVMLALKQKDIGEQVIEILSRQASGATRICCLQNGMGHLEKLGNAIGGGRLYAAVTTEGAMRISDTEVRHTGQGFTRIGAAESGQNEADSRQYTAALIEFLSAAGFQAAASENIRADIWDKLIINCVVNPVTALLDIRNGRLLEERACMELMRSLYDEAEAVAAAAGYGRPEGVRWQRLIEVCRSTAGNRSSMLQDLSAGRVTELEWLTGSLLREAERAAIKLPFHHTLYRLIQAKEALLAARDG